MKQTESSTIEQVLFERMGISVEDALATGTDAVDERLSQAAASGMDVEQRFSQLGSMLEQLTEPDTIAALQQILKGLPQLARLAELANSMPDVVAALGDVMDEYQSGLADQGIDVEKALVNGMHATLYLGNRIDSEHLQRLGELLDSNILDSHAVGIVDNAAKSLSHARQELCEAPVPRRVGMFGLLKALRDPEVQRSLAFAVQFGKCFGRNLNDQDQTT
ncbi:MAG: DUF1641 domain-containing protein [Pirellulaceae bacterium]